MRPPEDHCSNFVTHEQLQFKDFSLAMASKEIMGPFKTLFYSQRKDTLYRHKTLIIRPLSFQLFFFPFWIQDDEGIMYGLPYFHVGPQPSRCE